MGDILDKLLDSDCSDLDDDIELGDESGIDSDWEYESENERVLCGGGVGDADCGGVVGDADVVGADVGGGVSGADCRAGSSVVRDWSIEDSVCRDSGDECGGLVGGDDDDDQSDNGDVDSGGDGDSLRDDNGGPDCLRGGVRGRGGVRLCSGRFWGVGGSGRSGCRVRVGGRGRRGVHARGGVHGPGRGLGVRYHGVADLQWEPFDIVDEELLDDTFPFSETEGLKVWMNQQQNVLEFLQLYLTEEILELIVIETNRFANQFILENPDKASNSYLKNWTDLTVNELQVFIGLVIVMGIVHKPNINSYWSRDELYNTPIFSKVMPRDRFKVILRFLHFNDNATYNAEDADRDHPHKVRPLLDLIRTQCQKLYGPGRFLSVDESLVLFKGRAHFRQYIKTKRARFG